VMLGVPDAREAELVAELRRRAMKTIWATGGCKSWYLDPRTGKNTTLWPGFTWRFRQATAHFSIADYHAYRAPHDTTARPAAAPAASASTSAEAA